MASSLLEHGHSSLADVFDILEDGAPLASQTPCRMQVSTARDVLEELVSRLPSRTSLLPFDSYLKAFVRGWCPDCSGEAIPISFALLIRGELEQDQQGRLAGTRETGDPLIESETFEPLDAVLEEPSVLSRD